MKRKKEAHWKRDQNLKDVLIHLYQWYQLILSWIDANQKDEAKPFIPELYNFKTYGVMNVGFWKNYQMVLVNDLAVWGYLPGILPDSLNDVVARSKAEGVACAS